MTATLETERLILLPLQLADAEQVQQIFPDWEVVKLLTNKVPWPFPSDGVEVYYREQALPAMDRGDEWHWTLRLKSDPGKIVGAIGLFRVGEDNRGFWLDPAWRGRGLMTEAVIAATDFWFDNLGYPALRAPKAVANTGSRKISERTGMVIVSTGERDFVSGRLPSEVWEVTRDQWHVWRSKHR
jgi:RimJ/RimL family protein N-acetyltransferase